MIKNHTLFILLLLIRIFSCVFEALLVPANFVITDLHHQLDIIFHDHVKKITHGILFGCACSNNKLFLKTRVNPGSIDIIGALIFRSWTQENSVAVRWQKVGASVFALKT